MKTKEQRYNELYIRKNKSKWNFNKRINKNNKRVNSTKAILKFLIILKIDQENKRVSLGYKQLQPKPWESVPEKYAVGDVVKGKVVRLVDFGAFVEVEKGVDGLVHVSQISNQWLENPISALQVGQEVEAKILDINLEKEKMTLSIKALLPEIEQPKDEAEEGKGKGKKRAPKDDDSAENELREWKDDNQSGVSIAEMLGNSEN